MKMLQMCVQGTRLASSRDSSHAHTDRQTGRRLDVGAQGELEGGKTSSRKAPQQRRVARVWRSRSPSSSSRSTLRTPKAKFQPAGSMFLATI